MDQRKRDRQADEIRARLPALAQAEQALAQRHGRWANAEGDPDELGAAAPANTTSGGAHEVAATTMPPAVTRENDAAPTADTPCPVCGQTIATQRATGVRDIHFVSDVIYSAQAQRILYRRTIGRDLSSAAHVRDDVRRLCDSVERHGIYWHQTSADIARARMSVTETESQDLIETAADLLVEYAGADPGDAARRVDTRALTPAVAALVTRKCEAADIENTISTPTQPDQNPADDRPARAASTPDGYATAAPQPMAADASSGAAPAGWYRDPRGDEANLRYWDGQAWTDYVA